MDEPTAVTADGKWNQERYDSILTKLKPFLRKSCGFAVRKDCYFLPMAGLTGENLLDRVSKEMCPWYDGPSLLELLDEIPVEIGAKDGALRVPVRVIFRARGWTCLVSGVSVEINVWLCCFLMRARRVARLFYSVPFTAALCPFSSDH